MFAATRSAARSGVRAFSTTRPAARDLAKMTLIGRIAGIEPKTSKNGKDFLVYKVATQDRGRPAAEGEEYQKPPTSWHTVFAHGGAIERLQNVETGSLVYVEANFTVKNEKDEASGVYSQNIVAVHERLSVLKKPYRPATEEQQ
ncbi:hypothetical protein JCM10207_001931 [Rhodosporidiobolus poonsookiae]